MPKDPRIQQLAREAAVEIKTLAEAHQTQIEAIYRQFRHKTAQIREGNAEELESPSVTPVPQSSKFTKESHDFTL